MKWTNEEVEILKENYGIKPLEEISNMLNKTIPSIKHKAERSNIKSPREWSDEEILYLRENYKTKTYKELSEYLGRTKSAVDLKINRLGLKKDKYVYNHNYFELIDCEEKAYWLGFIHADGCVYINDTSNSCELSIKLQLRDIDHLKKFNKAVGGNNEIIQFNRQCNINGKYYDGCQIRLYSEKIVHDLINYGIMPNKSCTIDFPNIREDLIPSFIRGVFDGDGCIARTGRKDGAGYVRCDFTSGSVLFINKLRQVLYGYGIKSFVTRDGENRPYRLVIGGMQNCDNFLNLIYKNATIYLDRKYNKKIHMYEELHVEQRLLRQFERTGFISLSEKESGNPETEIRVEGCV